MPSISQKKRDVISEQILHYLFSCSPKPKFTAEIAREIARDEEFTKALLNELKIKSLIAEVNKNPLGQQYRRRQRWSISNQAYEVYKRHQNL